MTFQEAKKRYEHKDGFFFGVLTRDIYLRNENIIPKGAKCKVYYPRDTSFRRNTIVHLLDDNGSIVDEFTINRGLNNVLKTFDLEEKEVSK